jgi:hypothetical protein
VQPISVGRIEPLRLGREEFTEKQVDYLRPLEHEHVAGVGHNRELRARDPAAISDAWSSRTTSWSPAITRVGTTIEASWSG